MFLGRILGKPTRPWQAPEVPRVTAVTTALDHLVTTNKAHSEECLVKLNRRLVAALDSALRDLQNRLAASIWLLDAEEALRRMQSELRRIGATAECQDLVKSASASISVLRDSDYSCDAVRQASIELSEALLSEFRNRVFA
jgi:hypothetical protein